MRKLTFTAPSAWASAFINDDWSGLEEDPQDAELAREVLAMYTSDGWSIVDCEDAGFLWNPDHGDAGDCQAYAALKAGRR